MYAHSDSSDGSCGTCIRFASDAEKYRGSQRKLKTKAPSEVPVTKEAQLQSPVARSAAGLRDSANLCQLRVPSSPRGTSWPWAASELGADKWQSWRTRLLWSSPFWATVMGSGPQLRASPLAPESPGAFRATPQSAPSLAPAAHGAGVQEEEEGIRCQSAVWLALLKPPTVTSSSLLHPSPEKPGVTWWSGTLGGSGMLSDLAWS